MMNLNYTAFFLISFLPLLLGIFWYHPNSPISKWSGVKFANPLTMSWLKIVLLFVLSFALVFGYINLVIHQMGFYELFFTDIMRGSEEAKQVVAAFLEKYGDKHRHFGHGIFHGLINAFAFALPFVTAHTILDDRSVKYWAHHFSFWLVTSMLIGGLIAAFV